MHIYANPNPCKVLVGDCVIRAVSIITNTSWDYTYNAICEQGRKMCDMPSSNAVWDAYLKSIGFSKYAIPNICPSCYTVIDFCRDYPIGAYLLATGTHAVAVIDGNYYDTWDSGDETPIYFYERR